MSRFRKRLQAIWPCQYPLVWTPKYRFRILSSPVAEEVSRGITAPTWLGSMPRRIGLTSSTKSNGNA